MIEYRKGYKYQLATGYDHPQTLNLPDFVHHFFTCINGGLSIRADYAWDGPTNPAVDSKNAMRGSLVHDVLYQAIRETLLIPTYRRYADEVLDQITKEDGMWWARRKWWRIGLRKFGSASASTAKEILTAP